MNEIKAPDGEQTNSSFNEDFDFGESETNVRTTKTSAAPQINKTILILSLFVAIAIVAIMGYRFYHAHLAQLTKTSHAVPSETPQSAAKAPSPHKIPMPPPVTAPSASETHFTGIAEAFNEADHTTPSSHTSAPNAPGKTGSIQNLQKELFATENSSAHTAHDAAPAVSAPTAIHPTTSVEAKTLELAQGLNKLTQQMNDIFEQIKYLDSYTRDVSDNLNKLNESISALDGRLSALTNTTSTLSKDVGNVRNDVGRFKKVLKEDGLDINIDGTSENDSGQTKAGTAGEKIVIEEPEYRVHAVIPGRAWLKSSHGQIITVAEGDAIGNYGKILVIDAANGVVLTSSGVAFR